MQGRGQRRAVRCSERGNHLKGRGNSLRRPVSFKKVAKQPNMRTGAATFFLIVIVAVGLKSVDSYKLNRRDSKLNLFNMGEDTKLQNDLRSILSNPKYARPRRAPMTMTDVDLAREIMAAERLASGIITDVQSVLSDLRQEGGNPELWALIENALIAPEVSSPKDPNRLLRLS